MRRTWRLVFHPVEILAHTFTVIKGRDAQPNWLAYRFTLIRDREATSDCFGNLVVKLLAERLSCPFSAPRMILNLYAQHVP